MGYNKVGYDKSVGYNKVKIKIHPGIWQFERQATLAPCEALLFLIILLHGAS